MPMVRVSNGGTGIGMRYVGTTSARVVATSLAVDNDGTITRDFYFEGTTFTNSDALSCFFSNQSPYNTICTVLKAGYYYVNGTWTNYSVNQQFTLTAGGYVVWYSDLKQH